MKKPNLLYIFSDQQRWDTMRCYGNEQIETPNLQALADESFVFEHPYVTQPVCSPARATMMTGLYPHTSGILACNIPLAPDTPTIAELVDDAYECAYMGKWHLGDEIFPQHGFTQWVGSEDSYRHSYSKPENLEILSDYHHFLIEQGYTPDVVNQGQKVFSRPMEADMKEEHTKAAFLGNRAAEFIKTHTEDPFVLCVSYLEPHPPHTGPLNDYYDPWSLPTGPNFMRQPPGDAALLHRLMSAYYMASEEYGYDLRTEEGWRHVRARYWGNVTLVDRSVGVILNALEEAGLADDTIVVFTSDHGEMAGDHGILGKTVMYEESVKVPLLMRVPALGRQHRLVSGNVGHIDLVPTLLDLMGASCPRDLQGVSRVPVLRGESSLEDNDVFIEWHRRDGHPIPGEAEVNPAMSTPWRTIISADRWKLNLSTVDQCELYDLNTDPYEQVNLFNEPDQQGRIGDLTARVCRWQKQTGDTVALPAG